MKLPRLLLYLRLDIKRGIGGIGEKGRGQNDKSQRSESLTRRKEKQKKTAKPNHVNSNSMDGDRDNKREKVALPSQIWGVYVVS